MQEPADRSARPSDPAADHPAPPGRPVLPDVTEDERDLGWGDATDPDDDDRYLREVPPHHGT